MNTNSAGISTLLINTIFEPQRKGDPKNLKHRTQWKEEKQRKLASNLLNKFM